VQETRIPNPKREGKKEYGAKNDLKTGQTGKNKKHLIVFSKVEKLKRNIRSLK
jgi:hypothetical protein